VIGYKNNTKKEWTSDKTWDEITRRQKIKGIINVSKTREQEWNTQILIKKL